jgi:hypothetical protein
MQFESEAENADIFSGCGNGTLDAAIQHDPGMYGENWDESKGDRWLKVCINDEDLHYIRLDIYHFAIGKPAELEGDFIKPRTDDEVQKITAEFPLLNRIEWMYADALYNAVEVNQLREEGIKLKSFTTNQSADLGLRKLIYCCDEALKVGLSLGLWCD